MYKGNGIDKDMLINGKNKILICHISLHNVMVPLRHPMPYDIRIFGYSLYFATLDYLSEEERNELVRPKEKEYRK